MTWAQRLDTVDSTAACRVALMMGDGIFAVERKSDTSCQGKSTIQMASDGLMMFKGSCSHWSGRALMER